MTVGVLIHGCHVETDGARNVYLGNLDSNHFGRVTKGLYEAFKAKASLVFFGTGASRCADGTVEARHIFNLAIENFLDISKTCGGDDNPDPYENSFLGWLHNVAYVDEESQNTVEEIRKFLDVCIERGVQSVVAVSSAFHAPRCLQQASIVLENHRNNPVYDSLRRSYNVTWSDINPTGMETGDVVIVEPAHRGDNPKVPFYKEVRRLFQFLSNPEIAFRVCEEIRFLIDRFERELRK